MRPGYWAKNYWNMFWWRLHYWFENSVGGASSGVRIWGRLIKKIKDTDPEARKKELEEEIERILAEKHAAESDRVLYELKQRLDWLEHETDEAKRQQLLEILAILEIELAAAKEQDELEDLMLLLTAM